MLRCLILLLCCQLALAADPAKTLRYPLPAPETGFDPAATADLYSDVIMGNIFEPPLAYDPLAKPATLVPNTLAALPEIRDGGRTFILHLKPGIYFADDPVFKGQKRELVAADYVYSWQRLVDPNGKAPWSFLLRGKVLGLDDKIAAASRAGRFDYDAPLPGLIARDRHTLEIRLLHPDFNLPHMLANTAMGALAREVVEAYGQDIDAHPVGTGPYLLREWQRGTRTVLEANPAYRRQTYAPPAGVKVDAAALRELQSHPHPAIGRIEFRVVESGQAQWLAFLNGEFDLLEGLSSDYVRQAAPGGVLTPKLARQGVRYAQGPQPDLTYELYNMEDPVVGGYTPEKIALRRALAMAYPVHKEAAIIRNGLAMPAQGVWAPGISGYDPDYRNTLQRYDPAQANALLDVYGYRRGADGWRRRPDGSALTLRYLTSTGDAARQLNELLKKSYDAIHVRLRFETTTFPDLVKRLHGGHFQITGAAWGADYPDAENFLQLLYGPNKGQGNDARFDLPEYNALYQRISRMPDSRERRALILDMQRLIAAYAPWTPRVHRLGVDLAQGWVRGYFPHVFLKKKPQFKYLDLDLSRRAQRGLQ